MQIVKIKKNKEIERLTKIHKLKQETLDEQSIAALNFSFYQNCFLKVWRPW